ncbi:dihydroorotase [Candidatus Enterovibrio escicola]|uniref:Dihydroorotase n=1 Tax=Candidatus Enterovibrio escicola TaxID=1927127 RepID=A0A2A5T4B9_9GAMM|nr:dihydroorotase [Candidatus Enterovibrio escacola]PCS22991.1 Dihydroorotase [Candidatus Enterovibrio escacola]
MCILLFKNSTIVNENQIFESDLLVENGRITKIEKDIEVPADCRVIDAKDKYLLPGMIDDQVHFREPGLTHKGEIATESKAAIAGGITTYMEMPNVNPPTTTLEALEDKYQRATEKSYANYSFYLGATNDNIEEISKLDPNQASGVKVFMGASTGNMLVDSEEVLAKIFANCPVLIATHCEDPQMITELEDIYRKKYGEDVPMQEHASIRSAEACMRSSQLAVTLAKKYGTSLHLLHLTTANELYQFESVKTLKALANKKITAEVCVHHLFFNSNDYERLGSQIKCNPAIKDESHQKALIQAVKDGIIDIIATDHAPHTWEEKQNTYFKVPSGMPLVQHGLQSALEFYHRGIFDLELVVQKTAHAPAVRYQVKDRGFIREGYWADLVLIDFNKSETVSKDNIFYKCSWSPFEGHTFGTSIDMTLINGNIAFEDGQHRKERYAQRIEFERK